MKKSHIIAAVLVLIGSLMAAIGLSAPAQAAPAVTYDSSKVESMFRTNECFEYVAFDYEHETYVIDNDVWYGVEVRYRNCPAPAVGVSRRTQVLAFTLVCRSSGWAPDPNWMHANLYFYDKDGHSYNPTYKEIECPDQETWNERTFYSSSDQWFHKCAAGPPRWTADLKVDYAGAQGYDDAFLAGTFWGYDGGGQINC